jgi:thiamine-phosphate pyrophosphorylase
VIRIPPVYAITDPRLASGRSHEDLVEAFTAAGVRIVQVRDKGSIPDGALFASCLRAQAVARSRRAALVVNDRADIARLVGCGVHLGGDDLAPEDARRILGPQAPIGVSTHSLEGAREAFAAGTADYVAFGPVFASSTKPDRPARGLDELARVAAEKNRPLVAVGGIGIGELDSVWEAGADSAAMVSALLQPSPEVGARAAVDRARVRFLPAKIWLIGFMGSGKTTIGRILARRLERPFFDMDEEIEIRSGRTVRAIFEADGEPEFRRREREYVAGAEAVPRGVFAAGGGTFGSEANRASILRSATVVFLDVPFEALASRLAEKTDRPLFRNSAEARHLLEERRPFYKMAPVTVPLTGRETPEEAAERVLETVEERACVI